MKTLRAPLDRQEAVRFYVGYDCRKKLRPLPRDLADWNWDDPDDLDARLERHGLKPGAVSAYKLWSFVELCVLDLLHCAIARHVFKGQPQVLSLLAARGAVETWKPQGLPEWFDSLQAGDAFPQEWAMILRPSTVTEQPAEWYVEDGTGRALCFLQRVLGHAESRRVAYAYLGVVPDESSNFIRSRPELAKLR